MSAGRSYRRRAGRWQRRQPDVELSAATRAWISRMIVAHDDEDVTEEEFCQLLLRGWAAHLDALRQAERVEAALQLHDHAASSLLARRVRTTALYTAGSESGSASGSTTGG